MPASHKVACHWAEQIASGELQPHAVDGAVVAPLDAPGAAPHAIPGSTLLPEE